MRKREKALGLLLALVLLFTTVAFLWPTIILVNVFDDVACDGWSEGDNPIVGARVTLVDYDGSRKERVTGSDNNDEDWLLELVGGSIGAVPGPSAFVGFVIYGPGVYHLEIEYPGQLPCYNSASRKTFYVTGVPVPVRIFSFRADGGGGVTQ